MKEVPPPSFYGLVLVFGLPGTGKSTLAKALADAIHAVHLNTDIIRSESGLMGRYTEEDKAAVYAALFDQAKQCLEAGSTVVLDGTFSIEDQRSKVQELAHVMHLPLIWIEVRAAEDVVKKRVSVTRPYSEADFDVYELIRNQWQPLNVPNLILHTDSQSIPDCVKKALDWIHTSSTNKDAV